MSNLESYRERFKRLFSQEQKKYKELKTDSSSISFLTLGLNREFPKVSNETAVEEEK